MPWLFDVVMEAESPEKHIDGENYVLETENLKSIILGMAKSHRKTVEHSSCNSDESSSEKAQVFSATKRRRRRRRRKRKVTGSQSRYDNSLAVSGYLESTSDSEDEEPVNGDLQDFVKNSDFELESGCEISQDETYHDSIRKGFIMSCEQRMVNEKLLNENEELNEVITALEAKLSNQFEKSTTMQKSLKESKSDNRQLQRQKIRLQKTVKTQLDSIANLKERTSSLRKTCDDLSHERDIENGTKMSELDNINKQIISKDEQLKLARERNKRRCEELTKAHNDTLSKIAEEARGITAELSKTLGCSSASLGETGGHEAFGLLQQANRQLTILSQRTVPLQKTVQELKENVESQTKSLSKLSSEKKSLREELFELSKQNKTLLKDKAKLQREIESFKKESVKAKNLSQSFKTRLEELKANIRSVRREKETVMQEKQNVELRLKELGVDHEALKKELDAKKARKERPMARGCIPGGGTNRLITPKVQEELKGLFIKSTEELDDLDTSLVELEHRKKEAKGKLRSSDVVREYLKRNTSRLVQKHEEMCERSERLDNVIAKMTDDGEQLRKMVRSVTQRNEHLSDQVDMFIDELNCGYMERCALKKAFDQNCVVLAQYVDDGRELKATNNSLESRVTDTTVSWKKDKASLEQLRDELRKARAENEELRSGRRRHERSLENYKELVRGYSRVASRSSEMKTINRDLLSFVAFVQKQKEALLKKVTGIHEEFNLIQVMYHKLKGFSGKQGKKMSSISLLESNEEVSEKSLQVVLQGLKEKLQNKAQLIASLKRNLDAERGEGDKLQEQIEKLLSNGERVSLQLYALKISKKTKRSSFMNFKKKRSENEQMKSETGSLNEKQFSIMIQLILAKQELANEIKESLEMESRLCILARHGEEYTELLHKKSAVAIDTATGTECATGETDHKAEVAELFKEKKRFENEFAFNEAHEGLLEKQIAQLKKQRKFCTKALRKYEEELDGFADQSIVQALVDILMTSSNHDVIRSGDYSGGGRVANKKTANENPKRDTKLTTAEDLGKVLNPTKNNQSSPKKRKLTFSKKI